MGTILEVACGRGRGLGVQPGARGGMGGVRGAWQTESWTLRVIEMRPGARGVAWVVPARRDVCSGGR